MKRHIIITLAALAALTSCVSMTQVAQDTSSQRYQDGIYYAVSTSRPISQVTDTETQDLINRTRGSQIFLKNEEKVDTLFIPQNMSATLKFNDNNRLSSITLNERSSWNLYWGYSYWDSPFYRSWYHPYSVYASWHYRWYDPFWYDPFWYDPWYYGGWYDPFYYRPYYSSWYYSPWYYDPWYYGYLL